MRGTGRCVTPYKELFNIPRPRISAYPPVASRTNHFPHKSPPPQVASGTKHFPHQSLPVRVASHTGASATGVSLVRTTSLDLEKSKCPPIGTIPIGGHFVKRLPGRSVCGYPRTELALRRVLRGLPEDVGELHALTHVQDRTLVDLACKGAQQGDRHECQCNREALLPHLHLADGRAHGHQVGG